MLRVRVVGTGWEGGPSLNTFYFSRPSNEDVDTAVLAADRVHAAFTDAADLWPSNVPHVVTPLVDVMNHINGEITDTLSPDPTASIPGGGPDTSRMAPHTALLLQLRSATFLAGRRVQGRAFASPLYSAHTTGVGAPTATAIGLGEAFGSALLDAGGTGLVAVIWRRPRPEEDPPDPDKPARDGAMAPITSVTVGTKFAVLRSRRD